MENTSLKDKKSEGSYAAFFDLDQTIIGVNSASLLIKAAYKKGHMTSWDILKGYYLSILYKLNLRDPAIIIRSISGWLNGVSESDLQELSTEIFNNQIINFIHKEVSEEIKFHKTHNGKVVILSSSIYPVCRTVANHLEVDDIVCSILEVNNGLYTGKSVGHFCFGREKAVRLEKYCNENNISQDNSWYYGDAISDIFVLSSVGNPVCINPDNRLKKAALRKRWKILYWSS